MYSYEIRNFVNDRNGKLNREEFGEVINAIDNPQITDVNIIKENGLFDVVMTVSDEPTPIEFSVESDGLTTSIPSIPKYV